MYFEATISKISTFKNTGFRYSFAPSEIFLIFIHISYEQLSPKLSIHTIFCKNSIILSCVLKRIARTMTKFLLLSTEGTKN